MGFEMRRRISFLPFICIAVAVYAEALPSQNSYDGDAYTEHSSDPAYMKSRNNDPYFDIGKRQGSAAYAKRDGPQELVSANISCDSVEHELNGTKRWAAANGDDAIKQFSFLWDNDLCYCKDCLGLKKENCNSNDPSCEYSIREAAGQKRTGPARWDQALWLYAGAGSRIICGVDGNGCEEGDFDCQTVNGSAGGLVIAEAMIRLSTALEFAQRQLMYAQDNVEDQSTQFGKVFAPLPDYKSGIWTMAIVNALLLGAVSLIPGLEGVAAALPSDFTILANAITSTAYSTSQDTTPPDELSPLGKIINTTSYANRELSQNLFSVGEVRANDTANLTTQDLMRGGKLNDLPAQQNDNSTMQNSAELILYQQLAAYTWTNQQSDGKQHPPIIAYATGDCDKLDYSDEKSVPFPNIGLESMDVEISWGGSCFWLLQGYVKVNNVPVISTTGATIDECSVKALPGGTNKELSDNSNKFSGLSLIDFIQPSVDGWKANGMTNGYSVTGGESLWGNANLAPGALNISVCDYLANRDMPGVGCPRIAQGYQTCSYEQKDDLAIGAGQWHDGTCHLHLIQYQEREPDETNPYTQYQLYANVADDSYAVMGEAAKEWVDGNIGLWNTPLPDIIWIDLGEQDHSDIQFWYQDQWWTSANGTEKGVGCSSGWWDSGSRQLDCVFPCPTPVPNTEPKASATVAHPMPNVAMQSALMIGTSLATNIYRDVSSPTPSPPSYPAGTCRVLIEQFQPGSDMTLQSKTDTTMEAYLFTTKPNGDRGDPIADGNNGQIPFNFQDENKAISGVRGTLTVSWPNTYPNTDHSPYYAPLRFNYDGPTTHLQWFGDDQGDRGCNMLNWDTGERQWRSTECKFPCD